MAVYINVGESPSDGGRPYKHLDLWCPVLQQAGRAGLEIKRVPNVDAAKPVTAHVRRRCPICFREAGPLPNVPFPAWLEGAKRLEQKRPAVAWTYDLMYPRKRLAQVGMASRLYERLLSRWRGTCAGRLSGRDSIPWYYDLMEADPRVELVLDAEGYPSRADALAAEQQLRERKRREGWQVSSDR